MHHLYSNKYLTVTILIRENIQAHAFVHCIRKIGTTIKFPEIDL